MNTMTPFRPTPGMPVPRTSAPMGNPAPRPMQPSVMPTMQPQADPAAGPAVSQPVGLSPTSQMLRQPMPLGLPQQPSKFAPPQGGFGPLQPKPAGGKGGVSGGGKSKAGAPSYGPSVMPQNRQVM